MPPSKTCSQIRFLIFRHPLVPLFQQSRKSDPPFLSVKVNHYLCIETSKIGKTPLKRKKFLSLISLKFYVWDLLTIRIPNFGLFFKKKKKYFSNARGPPKNFDIQNFKFFWKKVRLGFTGSWQIPKGTKSWIFVNLVLVL